MHTRNEVLLSNFINTKHTKVLYNTNKPRHNKMPEHLETFTMVQFVLQFIQALAATAACLSRLVYYQVSGGWHRLAQHQHPWLMQWSADSPGCNHSTRSFALEEGHRPALALQHNKYLAIVFSSGLVVLCKFMQASCMHFAVNQQVYDNRQPYCEPSLRVLSMAFHNSDEILVVHASNAGAACQPMFYSYHSDEVAAAVQGHNGDLHSLEFKLRPLLQWPGSAAYPGGVPYVFGEPQRWWQCLHQYLQRGSHQLDFSSLPQLLSGDLFASIGAYMCSELVHRMMCAVAAAHLLERLGKFDLKGLGPAWRKPSDLHAFLPVQTKALLVSVLAYLLYMQDMQARFLDEYGYNPFGWDVPANIAWHFSFREVYRRTKRSLLYKLSDKVKLYVHYLFACDDSCASAAMEKAREIRVPAWWLQLAGDSGELLEQGMVSRPVRITGAGGSVWEAGAKFQCKAGCTCSPSSPSNTSAFSSCSSSKVARAHPQVSGDTFSAATNVTKLGIGCTEWLDRVQRRRVVQQCVEGKAMFSDPNSTMPYKGSADGVGMEEQLLPPVYGMLCSMLASESDDSGDAGAGVAEDLMIVMDSMLHAAFKAGRQHNMINTSVCNVQGLGKNVLPHLAGSGFALDKGVCPVLTSGLHVLNVLLHYEPIVQDMLGAAGFVSQAGFKGTVSASHLQLPPLKQRGRLQVQARRLHPMQQLQ